VKTDNIVKNIEVPKVAVLRKNEKWLFFTDGLSDNHRSFKNKK
jgi:hypothetical protein